MEVRIDEDICAGFGLCNQHLPEVFALDDFGFGSVERDGAVPAELEQGARQAIVRCPAHAISEHPSRLL